MASAGGDPADRHLRDHLRDHLRRGRVDRGVAVVDGADEQVLARLRVRLNPPSGRRRAPSKRTIRRVLAKVDPQAVQDATGQFVAAKLQVAGLGQAAAGA